MADEELGEIVRLKELVPLHLVPHGVAAPLNTLGGMGGLEHDAVKAAADD